MQQCGICLKVYDESEYSRCPYCDGLLYDEDDDGHGLHDDNGTITCPQCGPV